MVHCKTSVAGCTGQTMLGAGVKFERIRRISGYLLGTLDGFIDGKMWDEHVRVKHCIME